VKEANRIRIRNVEGGEVVDYYGMGCLWEVVGG